MKKIYIIAAIAAVMAGISLFNFLNTLKNESRVNFENVVVANADIQAHTVITAEMLLVKQIPVEGIHPQAAKKASDVVGLVSPEMLLMDEQIMTPKLKKIGENTGGLSYTVPENMRAVTVAVDEVSGVAGFIRSGDKVDILGVIMNDVDGKSVQTSTMLLQNISVLAVGKTLAGGESDKKETTYTSVTLLVSPEDSVKLNLVTTTGAMRIILRGPTDSKLNNISPKTFNNLNN